MLVPYPTREGSFWLRCAGNLDLGLDPRRWSEGPVQDHVALVGHKRLAIRPNSQLGLGATERRSFRAGPRRAVLGRAQAAKP